MPVIKLKGISTVVLDIEGTICPISFVKEILYPYSLNHLSATVEAQWDSSSFAPYRSAFPETAQVSPEALIACVQDLVARDVKDSALKKLQGLLWREGYDSGEVVTPLFNDVLPELKRWHESSIVLSIFSSGSVEAQKLFFKYVGDSAENDRNGEEEHKTKQATQDLNPLFEKNFDTVNAGPKKEAESYEKIIKELGKQVEECLFLSDNVDEVFAAEKAGLKALVVDRPGNALISDEDKAALTLVTSLDEIELEKST